MKRHSPAMLTARLLLSSLLLVATSALAAVSAQLSDQNIDELETVRLSIKITDTRQSQTLDLSELEKDFHVLNTNTISQSRFLNGRGHSWVDHQITLQPKRTGTITIPSIEVDGERTPTLELRVRALSTQTRQLIDELVFFENSVSKTSIYVQSQLVLTRRLLYSQGVQLYSDLPGAPDITDAVVLTLGETRSGSTERDGRAYGVVEQQYAIFPERSGAFIIPSINITASVRLLEGDRVSRKGVRVGTEDISVEVLPVPAEYPADKPWLPAEKVTLFEVINPELSAYRVGDTLSHELLIHIEGNIGTIAPPIPLDANEDNFRIYPQAPDIQDNATSSTVKGSRLQTHSLVPLNPGSLALPASELVWWDTVNQRVRLSATKPRTLRIEGEAVGQNETNPTPQQNMRSPTTIDVPDRSWGFDWRRPGLVYVLGGITLLLVAVGVWQFRRRLPSLPTTRRSTQRAARQALKAAFAKGDDSALHRALLTYLSQHYNIPAHQALQRLRAHSSAAAEAVDALLASIYRSDQHISQTQRTCLRQAALRTPAHRQRRNAHALPELYPETS